MYDELVDEINQRINYKFMQSTKPSQYRLYLTFFILFLLITFSLVKINPKYLRKDKDDTTTIVYWKVVAVSAILSGVISVIVCKYL